MKNFVKKYLIMIGIQFLMSFISIGLFFLVSYTYSYIPISNVIKYGLAAFILSLIILAPAVLYDFINEIREMRRSKLRKKNKTEKFESTREWQNINFSNVKYVTSFIIVVFLTAFITKCGTEVASVFMEQVKLIISNSGPKADYSMNIFIIYAIVLPSIIPITLYYCWACTFLFEKYKYYKEMTDK